MFHLLYWIFIHEYNTYVDIDLIKIGAPLFDSPFWISNKDDSPSLMLSQLAETPKISLEDEFLCLSMKKAVPDIKECKDEAFGEVLATIKHALEDADWWYTACTCNRAVYPDSKIFFLR